MVRHVLPLHDGQDHRLRRCPRLERRQHRPVGGALPYARGRLHERRLRYICRHRVRRIRTVPEPTGRAHGIHRNALRDEDHRDRHQLVRRNGGDRVQHHLLRRGGAAGYWHACGWDNSGTVTYTSVHECPDQACDGHALRAQGGGEPPFRRQVQDDVSAGIPNGRPRGERQPRRRQPLDEFRSSFIPYSPDLRDFTATRSAGQIAMSWTPNYWTTGYEIDCATRTTPGRPRTPVLHALRHAETNQDDTDVKHSVTISTWTADGTTYSIDDTKIYDIRHLQHQRHGPRSLPFLTRR